MTMWRLAEEGVEGGKPLELYAKRWQSGGSPPDVFAFLEGCPEATPEERGAVVLFDQERRHELQQPLPLEEYLQLVSDLPAEVKLQLLVRQVALLEQRGERLPLEAFAERFPGLSEELRRLFNGRQESESTREVRVLDAADPFSSRELAGAIRSDPDLSDLPRQIDKYPVKKLLNSGGFKRVYLSRHEALGIDVVIKIPHSHRVSTPKDVVSFLSEARMLATLDHPGVVRVYDAGTTEDGLCYVVERFIDGVDLNQELARARPGHEAAARLIAPVAEALHYVHLHGLVHRDIKPANILIDSRGSPVVTDFGLALRNEDFGRGPRQAGTIAYMSPEQARGEGHLVDGRTDIYSLGVVLYELLTGVLPARGAPLEVLHQIRGVEPRPPRQLDDTIPKELERICLKALSKRASDRYSTAGDMAEDLRLFLAGLRGSPSLPDPHGVVVGRAAAHPVSSTPVSVPQVALKGLRSFEESDADFFLELLPGPRDREGLPPGVRFWKERIEATDVDRTFRVALLYGPSGCGKSSLVKAGLVPRLAGHVKVVFAEASPAVPATHLLGILRRKLPGLARDLSLADALAALRKELILPAEEKLLIVIDQFEQWLHGGQSGELVEALRQCDGEHVQCLLLVRDDFWMATTRFMQELEIPVVEGKNCSCVDLFDLRHAGKVLTAFGRACGALPESGSLAGEQSLFVDRALADLAEDGRVIPVRLALFADMLKSRVWSPATLRQVHGTLGIGVRFLEESFCGSTASPSRRIHERAARAVLASLLPLPDSAIRGHSRSSRELLEVSGYSERRDHFEELMRILDIEVRLLTPVDPEMVEAREANGNEKRYELTHDYLVPPLRDWLTAKQRETRRGRAALLLAERAASWNAQPSLRRLPSLPEWLRLLVMAPRRQWSAPQRKMMRSASLFHSARAFVAAAVVFLLLLGRQALDSWRAGRLVTAAGTAWADGPQRWGEACEHLGRAMVLSPQDARLEALLRDMSQRGSLIVASSLDDAEVRLTPQPGEGKKTDLELEPRLLGPAGPFRSGQRIRVAPGHYWVEVRKGGFTREFPVFVSQVVYADEGDGWREARRLLPAEVTDWEPKGSLAQPAIRIAEEHVVPTVFLQEIPRGFAFVPPGPYYRSAGWSEPRAKLEGPPGRTWFKLDGLEATGTVAATLERGFLMANDEVSVASFAEWFQRFREERRAWILSWWTQEVYRKALGVPVEVLRERWRKDGAGAENGGQAPADREAICRAVAASRARKDLWAGDENTYEAKLEASLEEQRRTDAARPVVDVSCYYAVLYARTHRPIDRREFEPWLAAEAAAATRLTGELVALRNELRGRGELVDLDSLPLTLRSSRLDNRRTLDRSGLTLQLRYVHWLYWGIQCAAQAPCKAVVGWARANREALSRAAGEQLEEIAARLTTDPWLDLRAGESEDCLNLVHSYAQELERRDLSSSEGNEVLPSRHVDRGGASSGRLPLERDNVLLWLDAEIAEAQSRQRELDNVREVVRRSVASGSLDVALPFRVRLLFGADMGWDIPRWDQWEKACRGADARTYACGNGAALYSVLANWATKEPRSTERERLGEDVSPYGVAGLAGNVSEWVWGPEKLLGFDYARGGNWHHSREWGRADRLLRAKSYYRGSNAGVRVVRNLPLDSSLTRG